MMITGNHPNITVYELPLEYWQMRMLISTKYPFRIVVYQMTIRINCNGQ